MNLELLNRVFENDEDAIQDFATSDNCAIIDWRDGFSEILEEIIRFLPSAYILFTEITPNTYRIAIDGKTTNIEVPIQAKQESLIDSANNLLQPNYEIRQFRATNGDAHSLFIAPSEFWSDLEVHNPEKVEKYFLSTARLSAFWNKGYFSRLFSKP
ncbi:hypothetical protein [Cellvibrio sp. UBA7661]|uniref:hypothetical protein n=1 Tax=Cellvibrio sp. UBA7661 TaxID=1946311 RepID=UPI002F35ECAD